LDEGYRVTTLAPKDDSSSKLEEVGCRFIHLPMDNQGLNPLADFRLRKRLQSTYKTLSPDLAIHYTVKPVLYGSLAAASLNISFVNNITGLGSVFIDRNWVTTLVKNLYKKSQKKASLVFFQNEEDHKLFDREGLIPMSVPQRVVPGTGVDTKKFAAMPYSSAEPNTFLLMARLIWDKGVSEFVEAAKEVKKEFPKARFQVLGYLDVKNRTAISRAKVDSWVKEGILEYLGETEDVRSYVEKAGCVVLPSYREGLPKTLLEAASMSRPIIATDVTGCREIVKDGRNGLLCKVKDTSSLAESMKTFLHLSFDEKEKMGLQGRALAVEKFHEKRVVASILKEIEQLLIPKVRV